MSSYDIQNNILSTNFRNYIYITDAGDYPCKTIALKNMGGVKVSFFSGAVNAPGCNVSVTFYHYNEGESPAVVESEFLIGDPITYVDSENDIVKSVGYVGKKDFLTATVSVTGTISNITLAGIIILSHGLTNPVKSTDIEVI